MSKSQQWVALVISVALLCVGQTGWAAQAQDAAKILEATGVKGGLVVHLGCGDSSTGSGQAGKLTAAFRSGEQYLVHGLDADAANVEKARAHIRSLGLYGPVSVQRLTGSRLPYTDNLVNLLVAEDLGGVGMDEVTRVLAPLGTAYVKKGTQWTITVKPRPDEIDEWTHYLHDADGNAVADDTVVGPPRHIQWVGGPLWYRSHETLASVSAIVTSGGRVFYIQDEGPTASTLLPPVWSLVARDAFNGVLLWKRSIETWAPHRGGFRAGPAQLPRRLVASGDRVFVTLRLHAPVSIVNAATGEVEKTFDETACADEIVLSGNILVAAVFDKGKLRPQRGKKINTSLLFPAPAEKSLVAVNVDTGAALWKRKPEGIVPMSLTAAGGRVLAHSGAALVCMDLKNGKDLWMSSEASFAKGKLPRAGVGSLTIVMRENVVLCADGKKLVALSAETGAVLWTGKSTLSFRGPPDILVVDGLAWMGAKTKWTSLDLSTGEVKKPYTKMKITGYEGGNGAGHARCYRSKATSRYLLLPWNGAEFLDLSTGNVEQHDWIRGGCQYGHMPANGLLYAPPHACWCFINGKLNGFYALAPAKESSKAAGRASSDIRLEKGPAYQKIVVGNAPDDPDDWPTYRRDPARSGATKSAVGTNIKKVWDAKIGGRLSSVVMARGKVFVASIDDYTMHALNADTGGKLWSFTTGGRVDSPPTIHEGMCLFGSADGWLYGLRADDGQLAWRLRAGPEERLVGAWGRLESAWPVPGSVLLENGMAYLVAGRSSFLDGGIRLLGIEPRTGRILLEKRLSGITGDSGDTGRGVAALPDVLSSDGSLVYLRHLSFDLKGERKKEGGPHLQASAGFLDDAWAHRMYWKYGKKSFATRGHKLSWARTNVT